jgi:hypothetical protein
LVVDNASPTTTLSIEGPVYVDSDRNVTSVTPSAVFNLTGADRTSGLGSTSYRIADAT